jgi:hypothetical protein
MRAVAGYLQGITCPAMPAFSLKPVNPAFPRTKLTGTQYLIEGVYSTL